MLRVSGTKSYQAALNHERQWREILFAKTSAPFPVLSPNESSGRRSEGVSTLSCNVLFSDFIGHLRISLQFHLTRDPVSEEHCLSPFFAFPLRSDESCIKD